MIVDLQGHLIYFIPNDLYSLLKKYDGFSLNNILKDFDKKNHITIKDYYSFLFFNELIFTTDVPELFPSINTDWHDPSLINHCIIDYQDKIAENYYNAICELNELQCRSIQFRVFKHYDLSALEEIMKTIGNTTLVSVEFILPYSLKITENDILMFCDNHNRITNITIHSSSEEKQISSSEFSTPITYITTFLNSLLHCGNIRPSYFVPTLDTFTESQQHNTCLNRKIAIDANGDIKNCPSMTQSYGNIRDTTLAEAIEKPGFKDLWYIHKDQIGKCKDCEFRHICTDCRAYLENPDDLYSAPLKCGYDPYTCTWEEWSTNPLKQQAIEYYGMQELIKK